VSKASAVGQVRLSRAYPLFLPPRRQLAALFLSIPLWWLVGLGSFVWQVFAFFLILALLMRRTVVVPRPFGIWLAFLIWVGLSAMQVDSPASFAYHLSAYVAMTVAFLYVFNSSEERLPTHSIVNALALYWAIVVVGGFAGLLMPRLSFHSPTELVLPHNLVADEFIHELVHVSFAQIHTFLGHPVGRPTALFSFTNSWGAMVALLTPFAIAALLHARTLRRRRLVAALLAASVVPIVVSLNRGLWLSLTLGLVYAGLCAAVRGERRAVAGLIAGAGVATILLVATPLGNLVSERLANPHSNEVRLLLYEEALERAKDSPLVGFGGPQPAVEKPTAPPIGTHGQLSFVLVSHGIPGLVLFLLWFVITFVRGARATSAVFWAHVAILIFLIQAPYYLLNTPHAFVVMIAAALIWREVAGSSALSSIDGSAGTPDDRDPAPRYATR
jgi:polysaccharide biosynthesis protein PslJ